PSLHCSWPLCWAVPLALARTTGKARPEGLEDVLAIRLLMGARQTQPGKPVPADSLQGAAVQILGREEQAKTAAGAARAQAGEGPARTAAGGARAQAAAEADPEQAGVPGRWEGTAIPPSRRGRHH
ncbi:MAG: hypothetical protein ABI560_05525, partial [Myxococcales bacterium]